MSDAKVIPLNQGDFDKLSPQEIKQRFQDLCKSIPELKGKFDTIHLTKSYISKLSNMEFVTLYYMPGLKIATSKAGLKYVEKRRKQLNLIPPEDEKI